MSDEYYVAVFLAGDGHFRASFGTKFKLETVDGVGVVVTPASQNVSSRLSLEIGVAYLLGFRMVKASVPGGHKEMSSILTNEPKCRGEGCGVSADEYSSAHGAHFGDLTPYLIYMYVVYKWEIRRVWKLTSIGY